MFYLKMLRENEEMMDGNTGFDADQVVNSDDGYAVQLNDIAKDVEEINAEYADESSDKELEGQDLTSNPVEEMAIAIYESECNWNLIMKAIGTREIYEAARGREMVMESVDIKGFFNKIKQFFLKLWAKITAVVKQWFNNATAMIRTNKSFIKKYGSKLADGQAAYKKDADSKEIKGYNFKKANRVDSVALVKAVTDGNKDFSDKVNKVIDSYRSGKNDSIAANILANGDADHFRGKLTGKTTCESGDFTDSLKIYFFGSKEKETLGDDCLDAGYIKTTLSNTDEKVKDIRKAYDNLKKSFDNTIKNLNKLESAIEKAQKDGERSETNTNAMSNVTKIIANEKEKKNAASLSLSYLLRAIKAEKAQARKIANLYILALNKGKKKEAFDKADAKYESAGFLAQVEMI